MTRSNNTSQTPSDKAKADAEEKIDAAPRAKQKSAGTRAGAAKPTSSGKSGSAAAKPAAARPRKTAGKPAQDAGPLQEEQKAPEIVNVQDFVTQKLECACL